MSEDRIDTRLYVAASLTAPAIELDADRAHYLRNVLRLERGATVAVFNARDGEYAARVDSYSKRGAALRIDGKRRDPRIESDLWLVCAPIKRTRFDFIVEKATELGVSGIWPVFTQHTIADRVNEARMVATAIEAAEQSDRMSIPEIRTAAKLPDVLAAWPRERALIFCDESGGGGPIVEVLSKRKPGGPHAILTGPEGGFARSELDALRKLPFVTPVGLGPRVLRADTAALAALAIFQAVAQDRMGAPPPRFAPRS